MKQQFAHIFKQFTLRTGLLAVGIALAVGLSYVGAAGTYFEPTASAPEENTPVLVDVLAQQKVKAGGVGVGSFLSAQNAQLDGTTFINGTARPYSGSTLSFGGLDSANVLHKVSVSLTGGLFSTKGLSSATLKNTNFSTVCADAAGKLVLCPDIDVCANLPGKQDTVPSGYAVNSSNFCSVKGKRFLAVLRGTKATEEFTKGSDNPGGKEAVSNGNLNYHTGSDSYGNDDLPMVAMVGLANDGTGGWQISQIPGIKTTDLDIGATRLLEVVDKGKYDIKFNTAGRLGIKGKFGDDNNSIAADFYLRIEKPNGTVTWEAMAPVGAPQVHDGGNHEAYPIANQTSSQFAAAWIAGGQTDLYFGIHWGGNGDDWRFLPYSIDFNKSYNLDPGDKVDVMAFIYGISTTKGGTVANNWFHSSPNNFTYRLEMNQGTTIDILETPTL